MKEILLFSLASTVHESIQRLGELGIVDIKEIKKPDTESFEWREKLIEQTERAIQALEDDHDYNRDVRDRLQYFRSNDPRRLSDRVIKAVRIKKECQKKLHDLYQQQDWYETWGSNISIKDLEYLRKNGVYVRLYKLDENQISELGDEHYTVVFDASGSGGKFPVALFSRDEGETLGTREERIPPLTPEQLRAHISRKERQIKEVDKYLKDQSVNVGWLEEYLDFLRDRYNIDHAMSGMGDIEESVKYLRGYIPVNEIRRFKLAADNYGWGYVIKDPENPDEVPVYIKNPKWIGIIDPVMKFIDIVPGYKEVDVSIFFLVAFALFFAMLVGDAGYGAIFLLVAILIRKKLTPQMRFLIYVLSGATIIWGVLSGTYFGSESIAATPALNSLIINDISSFGVDNIDFMMHLSFLIGAIHLTVAHSIRIAQFINSIKLLSEIGWICFIWGLFFVAEYLVLGRPMPQWTSWLFISGASLVTLFSMEGKTILKSIPLSLANLPLSLINGFSDIVSYVRLFAVGLATATVAASFNEMILPSSGEKMSFIALILAAIALFIGHGLNIVLALMAVMVHGIRLNMLEFAGHLGVEFSGRPYQPFRLFATRDTAEESMNTPNQVQTDI